MDTVVRVETAKYLADETSRTGPNEFRHERDGIQLDAQTVIRSDYTRAGMDEAKPHLGSGRHTER